MDLLIVNIYETYSDIGDLMQTFDDWDWSDTRLIHLTGPYIHTWLISVLDNHVQLLCATPRSHPMQLTWDLSNLTRLYNTEKSGVRYVFVSVRESRFKKHAFQGALETMLFQGAPKTIRFQGAPKTMRFQGAP